YEVRREVERPPVFLVALGPGGPEVRDGGLPSAGLGILQPALVEIPEGVAEDARRGHGRLLGLRRRQGLRRLRRGALADRLLEGDDRLVELVEVVEGDALVAMGEVAVAHAVEARALVLLGIGGDGGVE